MRFELYGIIHQNINTSVFLGAFYSLKKAFWSARNIHSGLHPDFSIVEKANKRSPIVNMYIGKTAFGSEYNANGFLNVICPRGQKEVYHKYVIKKWIQFRNGGLK